MFPSVSVWFCLRARWSYTRSVYCRKTAVQTASSYSLCYVNKLTTNVTWYWGHHILWSSRYGCGCGPVVRQTTKWMNEWMYVQFIFSSISTDTFSFLFPMDDEILLKFSTLFFLRFQIDILMIWTIGQVGKGKGCGGCCCRCTEYLSCRYTKSCYVLKL
jgi:hypothetical protein